ncbi:MAG: radical SAM family heme chaperone HemW, partial [Woeseiaceae bacterium]|nr:radical SAM family heme chaperone HemW [Woeseiaceae bacterium]
MTPPPLSLYVHLPWCVRKCPYCDFNSHTAGDAAPKERYIRALLMDLSREAVAAKGRILSSIFLGGGTPSLFSPQEIDQLLNGVRALFSMTDDVEITMEANPGTVECGSPAGYRQAGVTRLSIGAQSFDDALLTALGRIHSSDDIARAYREAVLGGFDNINLDLMHGLPGQTIELAMADLNAAIALDPAHISWYQLTLEPNTIFHARPPANLPDDDLAFEIQDCGQELLAAAGYRQYEVSAYARDGRHCRHNLNYWQFGDYLAVGAGAHGKLTSSGGVQRYQKPANPLMY